MSPENGDNEKEPKKKKRVHVHDSSNYDSIEVQYDEDYKRHFCPFCERPFITIGRHMKDQHTDQAEIAKINAMKRRKDQRKALNLLKFTGDHEHNFRVLEKGHGTLITA